MNLKRWLTFLLLVAGTWRTIHGTAQDLHEGYVALTQEKVNTDNVARFVTSWVGDLESVRIEKKTHPENLIEFELRFTTDPDKRVLTVFQDKKHPRYLVFEMKIDPQGAARYIIPHSPHYDEIMRLLHFQLAVLGVTYETHSNPPAAFIGARVPITPALNEDEFIKYINAVGDSGYRAVKDTYDTLMETALKEKAAG